MTWRHIMSLVTGSHNTLSFSDAYDYQWWEPQMVLSLSRPYQNLQNENVQQHMGLFEHTAVK